MTFQSITGTSQTGELKLDSTRDKDLPAIANNTGTDLRVSFTATGQWCLYNTPTSNPELAIFNKPTGSEGYQLDPKIYNKHSFRYPGLPAGCLVIEIKDTHGITRNIFGGAGHTIDLPPGYSAAFVINDDPKWYADNSGQISLKYTASPKSPAAVPVVPAAIADLYNTGVNDSRQLLGDNTPDPHYQLAMFPVQGTALPAVTTPNGALAAINWLPNTATARWIGPNAPSSQGPVGNYAYRTYFTLPPNFSSASVSGQLSADDRVVDIRINGVTAAIPIPLSSWTSVSRFVISSGFMPGKNYIDFVLQNIGGPTGIVVDGIAGSYIPAAPVSGEAPEIKQISTASAPKPPADMKVTCLISPTDLRMNPNCPVISYKGIEFWPFSYIDNRYSIGLVGYQGGQIVKQFELKGTRYVYAITVDTAAKTVTILGQIPGNLATLPWSSLA